MSAEVILQDWKPEFEVQYWKLVGEDEVDESIYYPWGMAPVYNLWLTESRLV